MSETRTHQIFCDLRQEDGRRISGTVLRYGDVCQLPWGQEEVIERGAFGDVENADIILNWQHDRRVPLARTQGGGLRMMDSATQLRLEADIPETTAGNDLLQMVRSKVLRGLSVEFKPDMSQVTTKGSRTTIRSAILSGVAVVDRPAYRQSVIDSRRAEMEQKEILAMIEEALDKRAASADRDEHNKCVIPEDQVRELADLVVKSVLAGGDGNADILVTEDRADEGEEDRSEEDIVADAEANAEQRADYYTRFRSLLPEDYQLVGHSAEDILREAVGDEVEDKEERSVDYLLAKAESVLERRDRATVSLKSTGKGRKQERNYSGVSGYIARRMENRQGKVKV